MGQEDFRAHSKAKQFSQFLQTKVLCQKNFQITHITITVNKSPFSVYLTIIHLTSEWVCAILEKYLSQSLSFTINFNLQKGSASLKKKPKL